MFTVIQLDELRWVEDELKLLKAFVKDATTNGSRELDLMKQIKQLILDLQDIREYTCCGRNDRLPEEHIKSITRYRLGNIHRMIRVYKDLLVLEHELPTKAKQVTSVQLNKVVPPIRIKKIVGFEDDADILISYLLKDMKELDFISITGMPGIGKTTLAWKIYHSEIIVQKFPTRIWVDIPLNFRCKDLCLSILKEFIKQGMIGYEELVISLDMPQGSCSNDSCLDIFNEFTEVQLIHAVHYCLKKRRFLLVMDDVWSAETFQSIRPFLPKTGKVLITSRQNHIWKKPHVLRFLNEKESWELLQLEVFGKVGECPEILKSMGETIAKDCDGSPLAIVAVGSSLGVTSSTLAGIYLNEKRWKKVYENVMVHLAADDVRQRVFSSVELSYSNLHQPLQDCFLYMGVFPEGHEIPVQKLTRLWIAERFVQKDGPMTLEETAEAYLYELIDRNLVMVGKIYPNGQIKTCRLHKVIHGFCKYNSVERDFYHEIRMSRGGAPNRPISLAPNHLRICINSHISELLSSGQDGRYVRSILCLNEEEEEVLHKNYSSNIHKSFKFLRILDCNYVKFNKFPRKLSKLKNLRYICLSCDDLDVVPEDISSLYYLETLVVDTQSPSLELKANMWRMLLLRHLLTKAALVLAIRGTGEGGKNLQTLTRLAPECCTQDVFTRASNLKMLGIRGSLAALPSTKFLRKLEFLQRLKLINESASHSQLNQLLQPDCFPPNLNRLTLSATYLEWKCMPILGNIHSLEILKLKNNAFIGASWITDADGFPRLVYLSIDTTDLISWEASPDCFPSLKCLVLNNCRELEEIPSALGKSLDTLNIKSVSESAVESARKIEREIVGVQRQQKGRMHEFKLSISS